MNINTHIYISHGTEPTHPPRAVTVQHWFSSCWWPLINYFRFNAMWSTLSESQLSTLSESQLSTMSESQLSTLSESQFNYFMFNAMYSTLTQIISSPRQFVVAVLLFLNLVQFKTHNILRFKKLSGGRGDWGGGGGQYWGNGTNKRRRSAAEIERHNSWQRTKHAKLHSDLLQS